MCCRVCMPALQLASSLAGMHAVITAAVVLGPGVLGWAAGWPSLLPLAGLQRSLSHMLDTYPSTGLSFPPLGSQPFPWAQGPDPPRRTSGARCPLCTRTPARRHRLSLGR